MTVYTMHEGFILEEDDDFEDFLEIYGEKAETDTVMRLKKELKKEDIDLKKVSKIVIKILEEADRHSDYSVEVNTGWGSIQVFELE